MIIILPDHDQLMGSTTVHSIYVNTGIHLLVLEGCQRSINAVTMEAAKFVSVATGYVCGQRVLVLCITSMSVTWHNVNEEARLQSRVEKLEAEDKSISISQFLGQGDDVVHEEDIESHQREARQLPDITAEIIEVVKRQLEAHFNCSTNEETKCTIEPGPKGDSGPPGPQGKTGAQGPKGNKDCKDWREREKRKRQQSSLSR